MAVEPVWIRGGADPAAVNELAAALADRLRYDRPTTPILMAADADQAQAMRARLTQPLTGTDVIVATSGSAHGVGRLVGLSWAAVLASAQATTARLGGPGQWLTTLPTTSIAGFQVVLRSVLAGIAPVVYEPDPRFEAAAFATQVASLSSAGPHYVSLVPTQLIRVLDTAPEALAHFAAVLVGGAQLPVEVAARARAAGVRVVATYGMTETAGGCVYDGKPLEGAGVAVREGKIQLRGRVLMNGYLDTAVQPFESEGEVRWLQTGDLGRWENGRLQVLGRADDVIISGGVNVHPAVVEQALASLGGQWVVVGIPDPEWGQQLVAVSDGEVLPDIAAVRAAAARLPAAARPKRVARVAPLPLLSTGKVDRRRVARRLSD